MVPLLFLCLGIIIGYWRAQNAADRTSNVVSSVGTTLSKAASVIQAVTKEVGYKDKDTVLVEEHRALISLVNGGCKGKIMVKVHRMNGLYNVKAAFTTHEVVDPQDLFSEHCEASPLPVMATFNTTTKETVIFGLPHSARAIGAYTIGLSITPYPETGGAPVYAMFVGETQVDLESVIDKGDETLMEAYD